VATLIRHFGQRSFFGDYQSAGAHAFYASWNFFFEFGLIKSGMVRDFLESLRNLS